MCHIVTYTSKFFEFNCRTIRADLDLIRPQGTNLFTLDLRAVVFSLLQPS